MDPTVAEAPTEGWGLDDFLDTIAAELDRLGIASTPPDRRTVRYYATLGVLDRPAMSGREARYQQRHLAQLLALKRLQAEGVRLAAIESRIAGATTADLIALAVGNPPSLRTANSPEPHRILPGAPTTGSQALRTQTVLTLAAGVHLVLDDVTVSTTEAAVLTKAAAGLLTRITALGLSAADSKE